MKRTALQNDVARQLLTGVLLFVVAWFAGGATSLFTQGLLARALALGLVAVAFNLVFGLGGMPSLGHAAFVGVGSYTVALGVTEYEWPLAVIVVVAIVIAAALGALLGLLALRTEGIHLLLLTLAFNIAVWSLAVQQVGFTKGDNGISGLSRSILPGLTSKNLFHYYLVVVAFLVLLIWVFRRSAVGQVVAGVSASATRMAALGYQVGRRKVALFAVSAAFASLGGILLAVRIRSVNPSALEWQLSAGIMVMAIIGGSRTLLGPMLGAVILTYAESEFSSFTDRWATLLGLTYIVVILGLPDGLLRNRTKAAVELADA